MAGRPLLPMLAIGAIGVTTVGLTLGYGLGQYTISGIDPFYATARQADWRGGSTVDGIGMARADAGTASDFRPATLR